MKGDQVPQSSISNEIASTTGGWSDWKEGLCRSGCTLRSKGFRERKRHCSNVDTCEGTAYDVVLCDDSKVRVS